MAGIKTVFGTRECTHPIARHIHGTAIAYTQDACRCRPCTTAQSADKARRSRLIAYGRWEPYVDADPAREHLRRLIDAGVSRRRIAERSGVSFSTLGGLLYGQRITVRIRQHNADAILAVTTDAAAPFYVPSLESSRRMRALVAIGYTQPALAGLSGLDEHLVESVIHHRQPLISRPNGELIAALYERLSMRLPAPSKGSKRALNTAQRHGWAPPLAWDDDDLDNPDARPHSSRYVDRDEYATTPDEVVVERLMAGAQVPRTKREQKEAIARLIEQGQSTAVIAELVGVNFDAARRTRNRITAAERQTA